MKLTTENWPILIVSKDWKQENDNGFRLRELEYCLQEKEDCQVIPSFTGVDALDIFYSRADLGTIVIDWDEQQQKIKPLELLEDIRKRNLKIPVILLTGSANTEFLDEKIIPKIDDCIWKNSDTIEFLAGRIRRHLVRYIKSIMPAFFGNLMKYAHEYKYAWHTPGHLGGQGFLRAPAGVAMYKFFGENTFRSDLSISVPELGSLLDHEGAAGDAEKHSAKVFGSDYTYYVLNGTSTVNQIIWRSRVVPNDIALVDRNCHKSLNYAMVITEAVPIYMIPRRNGRGIIGPVRLSEFSKDSIEKKIDACPLIPKESKNNRVKMSALTNSTYDGVCYNVPEIKKDLGQKVDNLHFDEAWYAYAAFNPMYKNHFGMAEDELKENHPPIFCSQSTHKLLTAFSQASMLHIRNGGTAKVDPVQFNEAYMMHGSTSPQYSMIASLDVATSMMEDNGNVIIGDIILEAVQLRKQIAKLARDANRVNDWFFNIWQMRHIQMEDKKVEFADMDVNYLATHQEPWVFSKKDPWHGFADMEENYAMLDPIKLTITTPGIDDGGNFDPVFGIPASIVTNFLIDNNIVCEKTDYYSFLLLNSLGTTKAKQGSLLTALFKFKHLFDSNAPLSEAAPKLVAAYPEKYGNCTLKEHCLAMHQYIVKHHLLDTMQKAFEVVPEMVYKPAEAFHKIIAGEYEYVNIGDMAGKIAGVMLVPYPPGIPILMGGERITDDAKAIIDYLKRREDFENEFPGYEGDIHGVERVKTSEGTVFRTMCLV